MDILQPEFNSDYLDIERLKVRLETETDPDIKLKIENQIKLLEDAIVIYTLHHSRRD